MDRKKPRASSFNTAPTVVMTLLNEEDDDDNIDQSSSPSCHDLLRTSRRRYRRHRQRRRSSSSSRDASPISRRRPHKDSLVGTAHSLASAESVRAELERIQNLGRVVPSSAASLSSRAAAESNSNTNDHHDDKIFRGYSNRRQSTSCLASVGELVGGGSVSSLSHLTPSMLHDGTGSFSSIPRMILKNDGDNRNSSIQDPLSYNFVDSDSDGEDLGDVEKALHAIRLAEELKKDIPKKTLKNDKQKSPSPTIGPDKNDETDNTSRLPVEREGTWQNALGA